MLVKPPYGLKSSAAKPVKQVSPLVAAVALTTFGLGMFAVAFALVATMKYGKDVSEPLIAAGAVISAIASGFIAWFTYTLWDATREIRESADATAERQQLVMGAQQTAMENTAKAMQALASASERSEELTRRRWAAEKPPELRLRNAYLVDSDDGAPIIHFTIDNTGHSDATITESYMYDSVEGHVNLDTVLNRKKADVLAGAVIQRGFPHEADHQCVAIKAADMGPKPEIGAQLAAAMGGLKLAGVGTFPDLRFSASIHFTTEGGTPEQVSFNVRCQPPSRWFDTFAS
jgi:hypothetical protein